MEADAGSIDLLRVLEDLARRVDHLRLPLRTDDQGEADSVRRELADQLHDYVLPRLRRIDAPVLAVVGGPTGAGKSTLVNSLVGARISAAGVLRPTTRSPVLAYHPEDAAWFETPHVLPQLVRSPDSADSDGQTLHLAPSPRIPPGLAVLDAPDIDSVVTSNRELAAQLLAAADMWIFVTTAARYADAVPWDFLRTAVTRGTAVAIVLDRVPPEAIEEVRGHFAAMLTTEGLGGAPIFVIPETSTFDAMLPPEDIAPLRAWLEGIARDAAARDAVIRHTLNGAIASLGPRLFVLASAADRQVDAAVRLRKAVDASYEQAAADVDTAASDGSLLRGEVLARWQDFVGTGEFMRALEAKVGKVRDRVTAAVQGKPAPGAEVVQALETGVQSLVRAAADSAAERASAAWAADPAGAELLREDLRRSSAGLAEASARSIRQWQDFVLELVRTQARGKRRTARYLALGVNGMGLLVMILVFAHSGGLVGGELAVAGGASALSQKILEAVLGDQAVRSLAEQARNDLRRRVADLLDAERERFLALLRDADVDERAGEMLRAAAQDLEDQLRGAGS